MFIQTRDEAGGVRVLTLDRPPANAIDGELLAALNASCAAAAADDAVRAVVVTGRGKFFSGGLDLKRLTAGPGESGFGSAFGTGDAVFALWTLPKPTVAMVNGHAIAGGAILALACDVRIAAAGDAKIGLNEVAIGLAYPIGAFEIARLALGSRQAPRVLLEAGLHPPPAACALGLIDEVVEPARLAEACLERARALGAYPRGAYAHTKRALQQEAVERVRNETREQRRDVVDVWTSSETVQALMAQFTALGGKPRR